MQKKQVFSVALFGALAIQTLLAAPQQVAPEQLSSSGKYQGASAGDQSNEQSNGASKPSATDLAKAAKVEQIGEGKYRIGKVRFDKKLREVSFPVTVNMRDGVVEYLVVTEQGKIHEAIFTTSASPTNIHLACVLLGQPELSMKQWPKDHTEIPAAHAVQARVTWPTNGPTASIPLAKCVSRVNTSSMQDLEGNLEEGDWLYNGSTFFRGKFVADTEGSVISIIGDRAALINGLRVGRENDEMHAANSRVLPKPGRTLKLVLTLPELVKK